MPAATQSKRKSALVELETLEAKWNKAAEARSDLDRKHKARQDAARELFGRRESRLIRWPTEYNSDGSPAKPDSEAAEIQRQIDALGQIDFTPEREHARRLEDAAKRAVMAHIEQHFLEIVGEWRPTAEAAVEEVREKAGELGAALQHYLAVHGRSVGLTEPIRRLDGRDVPGIDPAASLLRTVTALQLPVPVPDVEKLA
jgi:hypothetical protein